MYLVPIAVRLSRPIATDDGDVAELVFREPTKQDFRALSTQFTRHRDVLRGGSRSTEISLDHSLLVSWVSRLTGAPVAQLHELSIADGRACERALLQLMERRMRLNQPEDHPNVRANEV